jgi:hypothetical protein
LEIRNLINVGVISVALITVTSTLSGCQSNNFVKVDFKYDNLSHMSVDEAIVELDITPKSLIYALGDSFKAQNNLMLDRQKLDFFFEKSENYKECWQAQQEVFASEFLSYQQNNFSTYNKLDRQGIYDKHGVKLSCTFMKSVTSNAAESWFLRVEIPQGNFNTTISVPNVESFFAISGTKSVYGNSTSYSNQTVTTNFSSRLYIWAWRETSNSKTKVYLLAKPVNGQVESCAGCSIGYQWWKQGNGYAEFKLVKHYKFLLEDLAEKFEVQQMIQNSETKKPTLTVI